MIDKFRSSLGQQINFVIGTLLVLFIVSYIYNRSLLNQFRNTYAQQVEVYDSVLELKELFYHCNVSINAYYKNGNKTKLDDFNTASTKSKKYIKQLYEENVNDEIYYLLSDIQNAFSTYFTEACIGSYMYNTGNSYYYDKMYYGQSINKYLSQYCDELQQLVLEEAVNTSEKLKLKQERLTRFNQGIIVVLILIFITFAIYINLNMSEPLNKLVYQAKEITKGNLDVEIAVSESKNTVGIMTNAFALMMNSIKEMMESIQENVKMEKQLLEEQKKNVEYQKLLNQATFIALQTQTNPHFMFNTLNSISRTISLGKEEQAIEMIDSLSDLLRYSLSDAQEPVTLEEEIKITNNYLMIQKLRFSDRLKILVQCDSELGKEVILPKFTLQPLVENAIIHGISPKIEGGMVRIVIEQIDDMAYIKISDDGVGISKDKLKDLIQEDYDKITNTIGIWNTKKRIKIFTGNANSFRIKSQVGVGTEIIIMIKIGGNRNV